MKKEKLSSAEKAEIRKEQSQWQKFLRRMEKFGALIPITQNQTNGTAKSNN
jgi:hypothetical protein